MTPDPRRPGRRSPGPRRPRRADRGFVMLAVLMLTVIAVLAVGAMLTRLSVQTAVVERRIDDYRAHHDMLSVKAVVERWMQSANLSTNREDFLAPAFGAMRTELPGGRLLTVRLVDGQGTAPTTLAEAQTPEARARLEDVLARLPADRPDLVRRIGPPRISLRAAPDEVVRAIAAGEPALEQFLRELRDQRVANVSNFAVQAANRLGLQPEETAEILQILDFQPTLYRIDAAVADEQGLRSYVMHIILGRNLTEIVDLRPAAAPLDPDEW